MERIELDTSRGEQLVEVEREHTLRGYDINTGRGPGSVVKTHDVRIEVPVVPSDTLLEIVKHKLATNPYSISHGYPPFEYDHRRGIASIVASATEQAIKHERGIILDTIGRYNDNIAEQNRQFPREVARVVAPKRSELLLRTKDSTNSQQGSESRS